MASIVGGEVGSFATLEEEVDWGNFMEFIGEWLVDSKIMHPQIKPIKLKDALELLPKGQLAILYKQYLKDPSNQRNNENLNLVLLPKIFKFLTPPQVFTDWWNGNLEPLMMAISRCPWSLAKEFGVARDAMSKEGTFLRHRALLIRAGYTPEKLWAGMVGNNGAFCKILADLQPAIDTILKNQKEGRRALSHEQRDILLKVSNWFFAANKGLMALYGKKPANAAVTPPSINTTNESPSNIEPGTEQKRSKLLSQGVHQEEGGDKKVRGL